MSRVTPFCRSSARVNPRAAEAYEFLRQIGEFAERDSKEGTMQQSGIPQGSGLKRTPLIKPASSSMLIERMQGLELAPGAELERRTRPESAVASAASATASAASATASSRRPMQSGKPPLTPLAKETQGHTTMLGSRRGSRAGSEAGEGAGRMKFFTTEDVAGLPIPTLIELTSTLSMTRRAVVEEAANPDNWKILADEAQVSRGVLEEIISEARNVLHTSLSTYPVQLFQLVVKGIIKHSGITDEEEIHRRTALELMYAVRKGILKDEDTAKAMSLEWVVAHSRPATSYKKHMATREAGGTRRGSTALRLPRGSWPEHFQSVKSEPEETDNVKESRSSGKGKESETKKQRSENKRCNRQKLRTQLGGLYSSSSQSGDEEGTSSSSHDSELVTGKADDDKGKRSRRNSARSTKSESKDSDDPMSPRRANARRDREYLQALRSTQPIKYAGDTSKPELLVQWITSMTQYFSLMDLAKKDERNIAASLLDKTAAIWWNQLPKKKKDAIKSWPELSKYLTREFLPHTYRLTLWQRLIDTRQRTSVADYIQRWQEIQGQVTDLTTSVAMTLFLNGLKDQVKGHVLALQPTNLREVIRLARNFDETTVSRNTFPVNKGRTEERPWQRYNQPLGRVGRVNAIQSMGTSEVNAMDRQRSTYKKPEATKPTGATSDKKNIKCFNCGKMGHMARECWAPKKPFNKASVHNTSATASASSKTNTETLNKKPQ